MSAQFEQHPSAVLDYTADFLSHCARRREPEKSYALNAVVNPNRATGLQYRASTGGRTAGAEPKWPRTVGGTVTDGTVVWTAEAFTTASLVRTLSSTAWSATTGITLGTKTDGTYDSTNVVQGGVDGQDYDVTVVGTFSDGTKNVAVFTVQVRSDPRVVNA